MDDRVRIDLAPEDALRAVLRAPRKRAERERMARERERLAKG